MKPLLALPLLAALAACGRGAEPPPKVVVADAWCRAAPAGALASACYATLTSTADDRLVAVQSAVAERSEIHTMDMADGVMRMRKLDDGLPLPAGQTVALKPGAEHLMIIGPKIAFVEGAAVPLTLTFAKAAPVSLTLKVRTPPSARGSMETSQ